MELNSFSLIKKSIISSDNDKIAGLYNIGSTIGKGHYAVVKEAKHAFTGEKVAIKVIDKTKLDIQSREHLFSEVMCMKLVQHPNVVRLYEVIDTVHKLYLVLELGDGGDLYDYIMKFENGLPEIKAKRYFRQIVQAIAYCHNLHVVHRDLKPENVVFFEKVELVKLTDFGFSNKFTPGKTLDTSCGSLAYSAPEILLGDAYDAPKIDIWSLGVILYMLVCGHLPFEEANDSETLSRIMDCKYDLPSHLSDCCKNLIKTMLVRDPEKRANLEEILADKWLEYESDNNYVLDSFSVPLISQEHLTVEEHVEILTKMSEGNLASVEEIQLILDRNEYSYISATYFLLAERKLKRRYLENYCRMKLLQEIEEETAAASQDQLEDVPANLISPIAETNEDRIRRFSMILEDEEDEAEEEELEAMISLASVREELELTVPKFEVFSQSGISAPFPSRCCSRLSDSIDQDPADLEPNYRFSAFRHQFTTRNRCRSAIYNRRSLIYASHSLSSIPNFSQLLNDIHEENNNNNNNNNGHADDNSTNQSTVTSPNKHSRLKSLLSSGNGTGAVPRFQRNFSGTFQRRTNSISSSQSTERSFDDNFHYLSTTPSSCQSTGAKHQQRVSLPNGAHHAVAKKRCSYPALFPTVNSNLSQSHSSSDVSDNEISLLRGFNERKKVLVPKSFIGTKQYPNFFAPKYVALKPHTPDLMMSTSSIDSDASFAGGGPTTAPKMFCQQSANRRLRIKSGRSRPSSMGATFEDFQSLCVVSGMMISEENNHQYGNSNNTNSSNNTSSAASPNPMTTTAITGPLSNSPTVGNITLHRDICAPIHEEEELIRSRSYIDKETTSLLDNATGVVSNNNSHQHHYQHQSSSLSINLSSRRSVSGDCGRRKSESVEGTPARWALSRCHAPQTNKRPAGGGATQPLPLDSHSLSSQLTQSNFSLSSFASSLRGSKAMMNLVRGAFELQCAANRLRTSPADCCRHHSASVSATNRCASATVSGRQSRCEYASVTSLPLGNKLLLHSPIDDDDERLLLPAAQAAAVADATAERLMLFSGGGAGGDRSNNDDEDGGKSVAVAFKGNATHWTSTQRKNGMKKKSISHSADQIGGGGSSSSGNPIIRAGSNMSRKARFILSCCRPS